MDVTEQLATALRGLLNQAAVDGADEDEIDLEVVEAAHEALAAYDAAYANYLHAGETGQLGDGPTTFSQWLLQAPQARDQ